MLKGPVLGPMVISGVCFHEDDLKSLETLGVKDSKKLTSRKRKVLSTKLKSICYSYDTVIISPKEIDERISLRISLNRLEEIKMAEIINHLKPDLVYLDAADVKEDRFGKSIAKLLTYKPKKIISKHKADDIYPIVSASSIIAKDTRDKLIEELKKKYGDIGSGYTSDVKSIIFLRNWIKKYKKAPPIARESWETTKKLIREEIYTKKITDFV